MKPELLRLLLTLLALLASQSLSARKVTGRLTDASTGRAVGYATVALLRDTTALQAAAADADGVFTLDPAPAGDFTLAVSMVGYTARRLPVTIPDRGLDCGEIALTPGYDVDEVVVAASKPLVTSDAEKLTYSVEDDPQAPTSTLEEIIRKVPQLSIDGEGNVLLNGQSNYRILVNGRNSSAFGNNFKELIRTIPASQISRIEVITHPSTKYESEGVGGILNLILQRKKQFHGYNGSISAGATPIENPNYYGGANLSIQSGKFAAGIYAHAGSFDQTRTPSEKSSFREHYASTDNRYERTTGSSGSRGWWSNFGFDMSYQPDTLNLLTLEAWVWTGDGRQKSRNRSDVESADHSPTMSYEECNINRWDYTGGSVALNYQRTLGREGHMLTLSDEAEVDPDNDSSHRIYTEYYDYESRQRTDTRARNNTLQIDYANPLDEHHNIEAGLKHIYRNNTSKMRYTAQGALQPDETVEPFSDMVHRQHILGLYVGYGYTAKQWSGRLGARMERTWNDAEVEDATHGRYAFDNRQFNLVPYASLTWLPAEGHNLSFSYTERLQRPSIGMLSPAVEVTSPHAVSYGNPALRAAVFHSLDLRYVRYAAKWSLTLGVNAMLSNNNMSPYTLSDDEGHTATTYSNDVRARRYGFMGSLSWRPSDKFNLSLNLSGSRFRTDYDKMRIHTALFSLNENLTMDCALWKGGRLLAGEYYNTGGGALGSQEQHFFFYYLGLKQQFLKKTLDVSLMLNRPFQKYSEYGSDFATPTYRGYNRTRFAARSLSVRAVWRFGKQGIGVKRTDRSINNDDIESSSKQGAR